MMSQKYSEAVKTAQEYYNSDDADNFYFQIWGGEDIHIGLYQDDHENIATASERTVQTMIDHILIDSPTALTPRGRVIDLGSGYGGAARKLARTFDCHVTCINLSETQNRRNRQLNEAAGLSALIDVRDASFEEIPSADERFDLAWSQDAILHSGQREKVLDEIDRILKPGGELIFTDPMQADDCPLGVLEPVLDRIHLSSLGSFDFYRRQARRLGWQEVGIDDLTYQLTRHYQRVREELASQKNSLSQHISAEYIKRMDQGLGHWIHAGRNGYLAWGIMRFRKPG
jgi:sarcosine/dimethylglycine N-methyltransferase